MDRSSAIDFSSMTDLHDSDRELRVVDLVHNSVGALAYSILVFARELLGSRRPRIVGELQDPTHDQPTRLLGRKVLDLAGGRGLDLKAIFCHAV